MKYKSSYQGKYHGWDKWLTNGTDIHLRREDSKGLYFKIPADREFVDLPYSLKIGKEWAGPVTKMKIISLNNTVKTPAGTFKNVVAVKTDDDFIDYYAQNVGFIKSTYLDGTVITQLTSLINN